jgi:dihydrofolate synthase/folylpolyglutamate synthase
MSFNDSLKWLYSFQRFGIKLDLDRISYISNKLGNPHKNYKVIHVGGTNGKGSVCMFLESILTSAGYRVGVYTSPHLQHISERIKIGKDRIKENDLDHLINNIKPIINIMIKNNNTPTFFEIITAIAFHYFSRKNVDFSIIEVGLGGRYDATNIVDPTVLIITNVSLEHQNILGKNINDIALEKAGLIKKNIPVITAAKGDSLKIIEKIANKMDLSVYKINNKKWKRKNYNQWFQEFIISGILKDYSVKTQMLGIYQGENITLAISAIENLQIKGTYITDLDIINGIEKAVNPGRMEFICYDPLILIDGAHNKAGMESLSNSLRNDFNYNKLIVILGILSDKDIQSMLSIIIPLADVIITTKSNISRDCEPQDLKDMIARLDNNKKVIVKEKIIDAIELAKTIVEKSDIICITGSLFIVGRARDYIVS